MAKKVENNLHRIDEKRYLKNPGKWDVHFTAWDENGKAYAMAEKIPKKDRK